MDRMRKVENYVGRTSTKLSFAFLTNFFLASCFGINDVKAPGTVIPINLEVKMKEQLANKNLLAIYDTTESKKADPLMSEIEKKQGKFSFSVAIIGFDLSKNNSAPISSEITCFEKQSLVVFYDEVGQPASEALPVNLKLGKDDKGNLTMSYKATMDNQNGTKEEAPFLTFFSNIPLSSLDQDLMNRAQQGDLEAINILSNIFNEADNIDEVVYENLATGNGIDLKRNNQSDWKTRFTNFLKQLNPLNVTPVQAAGLTPTAEATSSPTPTPIPEVQSLNVAPEVKAVLDAQKAPYKVSESGEAIITVSGKEVVLKNLVDTKTDFGLAEDILNGVDADGTRYLFTEKGGWAKVIEPGTPEKRTKVDYKDFENGTVNASATLLYQKNPTIPEGAIDPQWWLQAGANGVLRQVTLTLMPLDWTKLAPFDGKTKPNGDPTLWLEFSKDGKDFVTDVQPNNNPSPENKNQKINMNWTYDGDRYNQVGPNIDDLNDFVINNKVSLTALLEPDVSRPSLTRSHPLLAGSDNIFSTPDLQTPGAQISLFTESEQEALEANFQILDSGGKIPKDKRDILVSVLPLKLALEPLTGNYTKFWWGDFQQ